MMRWLKNFGRIERSRRLSIVFGTMVFVGLLFVMLGIMASIKVTPVMTYSNKKEGFSIQFPAYWKLVKPEPLEGAIIAFVSPKQNDLDIVQENVNVAIKTLPREMTFRRLTEVIINQVVGTFGEQADIVESIPYTIAGQNGYRISFVGYGEKIKNPLQYVTAWTSVGKRVFIITFIGLQKDYPQYAKKVDKIIKSFKFIRVEAP